uniref:Rhodanese-like domain-containing protein 14, chloroplastic n=1 Tax=Anthurium amnicola TaxID=1678845 RepID=A0A1D1Y6R7_9ARAE
MMQAVARGVVSSSRASTSAASPYPYCKKAFVDNALIRSNILCRGRSMTASLPSDSTRPSKGQKKISKHERRAMVQSFVDKYRAVNAGKFPSASLAQKENGGSYYVIRDIIQELKYKSRFPPAKEEEFPLKEVEEDACTSSDARKEPSLAETEQVSVSVSLESHTFHESLEHSFNFSKGIINDINVDKAQVNDTKAQESPIFSSQGEKTCDELPVNACTTKGLPYDPSYDAKISAAKALKPGSSNDQVKQIMEGVENSGNLLSRVDDDHDSCGDRELHDASATHVDVSSFKDSDIDTAEVLGSSESCNAWAKSDIRENMSKSFPRKLEGSRGDEGSLKHAETKDRQQFSRNEDLHRGITRELEHKETSPQESTVWGNLRSLAHGIINFWKKM